jgi:hypothetical protein
VLDLVRFISNFSWPHTLEVLTETPLQVCNSAATNCSQVQGNTFSAQNLSWFASGHPFCSMAVDSWVCSALGCYLKACDFRMICQRTGHAYKCLLVIHAPNSQLTSDGDLQNFQQISLWIAGLGVPCTIGFVLLVLHVRMIMFAICMPLVLMLFDIYFKLLMAIRGSNWNSTATLQ